MRDFLVKLQNQNQYQLKNHNKQYQLKNGPFYGHELQLNQRRSKMPKKSHKVLEQIRKLIKDEIQKLNEENESTWTWIYKGILGGFKKADKKGDASLDAVARGVAFLIKTEFGGGAKNDFMKLLKKYIK